MPASTSFVNTSSAVPLELVHEIVLVGGSTRIPRIVKLVDFFNGKEMKVRDSLIFNQMCGVIVCSEVTVSLSNSVSLPFSIAIPEYCHIDGGTAHGDRIAAIDDYDRPGNEKFICLLTTRAGGLGSRFLQQRLVRIHCCCIIFGRNPQADLQAMDRAHRISQTTQVYVYCFVTEGSVEELMLERAAQKL
jgi:SNF2 family DNA or RNA helicase